MIRIESTDIVLNVRLRFLFALIVSLVSVTVRQLAK